VESPLELALEVCLVLELAQEQVLVRVQALVRVQEVRASPRLPTRLTCSSSAK
jgi:hypothetical protein